MKLITKNTLQAIDLTLTKSKDERRHYMLNALFNKEDIMATDSRVILFTKYDKEEDIENFPDIGDQDTTKEFDKTFIPATFLRKFAKNMEKHNTLDIIDNTGAIYVDKDTEKVHGVVTDLENITDIQAATPEADYPDFQRLLDSCEGSAGVEVNYKVSVLEKALKIAKALKVENITIKAHENKSLPSKIQYHDDKESYALVTGCIVD